MSSWFALFIAGMFEVWWAVGLKMSEGFSRWLPSILTVIGMIASFGFLSIALKNLPISITYAVWTGLGIAGIALVGIFVFDEGISPTKLIFTTMIVGGIIGLRLTQ